MVGRVIVAWLELGEWPERAEYRSALRFQGFQASDWPDRNVAGDQRFVNETRRGLVPHIAALCGFSRINLALRGSQLLLYFPFR
ncbi:MAG: hypothetical protein ACI8Y4_005214 [Candidatus Poriferisodalaceae bacterium]|jgi:hypothetical protein